ncbi:glutathione S-transferase [Variovorax paradoxus]|nr:glutathione S-transferase [Variovorax paradoxus]
MKLYEYAFTRSIRARWTLQELGVDFEAISVNLFAGEALRPEFLKLNPAAKLPVLVDGDFVLTESAAIVLYLAEKYGKFLPTDARGRAEVNRAPRAHMKDIPAAMRSTPRVVAETFPFSFLSFLVSEPLIRIAKLHQRLVFLRQAV